MRRSLSALFILIAAACAPHAAEVASLEPANTGGGGKSLEALRAESLAKIDRRACEAKGGAVRQEGMMGLWRCTLRYKDAGKTCRDGDECEGRCIAKDSSAETPKGKAVGQCEEDDSPFGCYGLVEDGAAEAFICVD